MGKGKAKKSRITKKEKVVWFFIIVLLISTPLLSVVGQATLSKYNMEVEKLKAEVAKQERVNESLTMKVNELGSFDNVREVAQNLGLEYNNNNIKTVTSN